MENYSKAQREIQRHVSKEIEWFNQSEERHFDAVSVIAKLSELLLTAFLAGFVQIAEQKAKAAGINVFQILETMVKNLFKGKKLTDSVVLKKLSDQTPTAIKGLNSDQIQGYLAITETEMRQYLETTMPLDRATSLANIIRKSIETQFLNNAG